MTGYTDITLLVAPFGFGSLGKGLAIAEEFLRQGYTVRILCDPVAQTVVRDSGIPTGGYEYRETLDLDSLDTGVVISSGDIGTPTTSKSTPFVVVDSLFWLRGRWERLPSSDADLYIAQRFFMEAADEAKIALGERLQFVDAILPGWAQNDARLAEKEDLVVVYPGGLRSPVLPKEYQESYLSWVGAVVASATRKAMIRSDKLVSVIPPQLIDSEAANLLREYGKVVEAGVDVLGELMARASCAVVAPGIETMLEACALGLTPRYLPAYNGSHIPQLIAYREAGVGEELCPSYAKELRDLEVNTDWLNKLTMDVSQRNLTRLADPTFVHEAAERLTHALQGNQKDVPHFPLGKYGSAQVVSLVAPLLAKSKIGNAVREEAAAA